MRKDKCYPRGKSEIHFIKEPGKYNNSKKAQQIRLLLWFKNVKPKITTIEAREQLGIMAPAARIFELRHLYGYKIKTSMCNELDSNKVVHKMACYLFFGGKDE